MARIVGAMSWFDVAIACVAVLAGATASVVGFGIGSLLTPLFAVRVEIDLAVAAVMVPHIAATALRCWRFRANINRRVLIRFGFLSAIGSLFGAFLYTQLATSTLTRVLGALLMLTAAAQLSGWSSRWHPRGILVFVLALGSGVFGGLAGNQGGMRAGALTAFRLSPAEFVATATATGLLVDLARAPVYVWQAGGKLSSLWVPVGLAVVGALIGTMLGERILLRLSPAQFGRLVALAVGVLGVWLLLGAAR